MGAAISLDKVSKVYGSKSVVDTVSFTVQTGEIFGFCGPNGAGKTTTIRMILGGIRPTNGSIEILGHPQTSSKIHQDIGFLSGDMSFDEDLTGKQYLSFVAAMYKKDCSAQISKLAKLLRADLNLKIRNYSRGNRQKIGLIAALIHQPKLLILDEPTSGFDPLVQETFLDLVQSYNKNGGTVFMSSHILSEVQRLCDRVAFIRDGTIAGIQTISELEESSVKQVHVRAKTNEIKHIINNHHRVDGLRLLNHSGVSAAFAYNGDIKSLLQFFGVYALKDITVKEQDLEEIFVHYYQNKESRDV